MTELGAPEPLYGFLDQRFGEVEDFMRNRPG